MYQYIIWILDVSPTVNKCIHVFNFMFIKKQADILYQLRDLPAPFCGWIWTIHYQQPSLPPASSCFGHESSAQHRARRRGEKWEWGLGSSFHVQGSLALSPL